MEKVKSWIAPFVVGAAVGMIALWQVFGFVPSGTAGKMASDAAQAATVAALVPMCVANAHADPEGLAAMRARPTTQRHTAVAEAGWTIYYPAGITTAQKRVIDTACANALNV